MFPPDPATVTAVANALVAQYGGQASEVWGESSSFLATNITEAQARAMSHDPKIAEIDGDAPALSCSGSQVLTLNNPNQWDLDRIDQRTLVDQQHPENARFNYNSTGQTVHVYVTDSGICLNHSEFQGRADSAFVAVGGSGDDVYGHGTACASLVGGVNTGVAKNVRLHSVKILHDDHGRGSWSEAIRGFNWINQHTIRPAVVSCSASSNRESHGAYGAEKALHNLINTGVTCVVAAGNAGIDAGNATFAKVDQAIVVGASDENDYISFWNEGYPDLYASNYGRFVTVFAPGTNDYIASFRGAFPDSPSGPVTGSYAGFDGTSGATPIVAGVAAQYLQTHPNARHEEVKAWIINNATVSSLHNLPPNTNTPNKLIFTNL